MRWVLSIGLPPTARMVGIAHSDVSSGRMAPSISFVFDSPPFVTLRKFACGEVGNSGCHSWYLSESQTPSLKLKGYAMLPYLSKIIDCALYTLVFRKDGIRMSPGDQVGMTFAYYYEIRLF